MVCLNRYLDFSVAKHYQGFLFFGDNVHSEVQSLYILVKMYSESHCKILSMQ